MLRKRVPNPFIQGTSPFLGVGALSGGLGLHKTIAEYYYNGVWGECRGVGSRSTGVVLLEIIT